MIKKERLQKLIEEEATIYCINVSNNIVPVKLKNSDTFDDTHIYSGRNYKKEIIKRDYETKEEAEFVAKNHDTRIENFEPPFELGLYDTYEFYSKYYGFVGIIHSDKNYHIFDQNDCVDDHFTTYQEAVDYAHELFNGEK